MRFTLKEMQRLCEFANWGVEKKNITDPDFCSAVNKLLIITNQENISSYEIKAVALFDEPNNKYLVPLSEEAKGIVLKHIEKYGKNPYHIWNIFREIGRRI